MNQKTSYRVGENIGKLHRHKTTNLGYVNYVPKSTIKTKRKTNSKENPPK
jgi:hypothetical protein